MYPYLLKGLAIDRPEQVWCTDITYIPLRRGWVYLVAIMDWFSRYVISWEVSVTLDASFCVEALERALALTPSRLPGVFNSDQGSQFTSEAFTGVLRGAGIRISMDGRGRCYFRGRQHLHRAVVAEPQARARVPARSPDGRRGGVGDRPLSCLL